MDDMLIRVHSKVDIVDLKRNLTKQFDMKYLGDENHILGMPVTLDCTNRMYTCLKKSMCKKFLSVLICSRGSH